ncbi:hypothetical protein AQUCO_01400427v1 [Aquilegia coerulea]|uniref:Sugar phosphate transporter domain-containing protein n=1 Tax=Aquilegia coerulea TaxID=218851 RepID=A0A2G5DWK0_AQUCA|nr:hypothetical protein AQUCO_01400427v1 [Aquilegia coerulea]
MGFYQIAKLSMIHVSCLLEVILDKIRYSRDTKLSITLVLIVAVCTVTNVSVNTKGLVAAFVAVWNTALQQYRKYSLGSFNLLGHTAPVQAASFLLLGPFLDYRMTNKRVDKYDNNVVSVVRIKEVELLTPFALFISLLITWSLISDTQMSVHA